MKNTFLRVMALVTAMIMAASFMVACKDEKATEAPLPDADTSYSLEGFTIVREDGSGNSVSRVVGELKQSIESKFGLSLSVMSDTDKEAGDKEILIGDTNRAESISTIKNIKKQEQKNAWAIRIAPGKIVITGTDDASTAKAVEIFISDYVLRSSAAAGLDLSAGTRLSGVYDKESLIVLNNGTEISIDHVSAVIEANKYTLDTGEEFVPTGSYPSITELRYQQNPENNGKLIATFSMSFKTGYAKGSGTVAMSENQGKTWKIIARPEEVLYPTLPSQGSMAHIYELPAQVGEMPAGTLLYSYNSVDYKNEHTALEGKSILAVWRSFDAGYTWEEYVIIDEAYGIGEGIWEPFMIYSEEDGYLYCFYSDDSDPDHDQKLGYKRSKDGVHWEGEGGKIGTGTGKDVEPVDVVAIDDPAWRPGMAVITKMGNGEYFLVYEQFGDWEGCPIYYKTTKNLADWGDPNDPGTLITTKMISSPSCAWLDVGGECGTLFVTSKISSNAGYIYVSTDYGKTWETIADPLESDPVLPDHDRVGYSAGLWVGADGRTLYYINSDNSKTIKDMQVIYCVKMTLYAP